MSNDITGEFAGDIANTTDFSWEGRRSRKRKRMRMSLLLARAVLWVAVLAVLIIAAGIDLRRRIIPNKLVALVAAGGVIVGVLSRPSSILPSLLFGLIVLLALLVCAHFDVLGAGDAKLIAAATLMVPPEHVALLLIAIAVAGGVLSGVYLAAFRSLKATVPYALAVLGGVSFYVASELYQCSSGISCSL
jgi:prepilin peptidase CpaA